MSALMQASTAAIAAAKAARESIRHGFNQPTAGMAPGMTQANMIALPKEWAFDFLLYAQRNPQSCPILDVCDAGNWQTVLAEDADLRTDIPRYRVWQQGKLVDEITDATDIYHQHPDLVTFLIGCSFTFETLMREAGIEIRHITDKCNVPMYRTNQLCRPAGRLQGELVVSMRPIAADRVADAVMISGRFPAVHGSPVHVGCPEALGISDIMQPDFGDAVRIEAGEIPVFWACGVTPQAAVMKSGVPFALSHAPGYMFITDVPDAAYHV
ncbi:putative hydro-lyase [Moellerella wisconsensis]|uniref:Hydro-lyase n=1 Tax=Moellerella wisconsensis TaxID=158849 RepID=A0ACD3YA28_9GAMM|nr:putative hydro-lyase [Moellerella wisconsensis]UNH40022.1 putative hydro-lyase [Moellerella wisconsensis]